jgi:diguanylate cyclase (GGDEF)-like protein
MPTKKLPTDSDRSGDHAGVRPAARSFLDTFVAAHPDTTAMLVVTTVLLALSTPAVLVFAVLRQLTVLGLAASAASLLLYGGGYLAAVWRRRDLRRQLDAARRDPATGLPTRAVAEEALHAATVDRTRLTVALADVDGLRAVNNGLGHAAGDQLLHTIANRLAQAVPPGGPLARLGGDEFVLLAPDTAPTALATAIGVALAGPVAIGGHRLQPRASVGIATTDALVDAHYALARADAAMYTAKDNAGNQALVFDPDRDGEPEHDGTRPVVRRRDQRPTCTDALTSATPRHGEDLVPVLWTAADLATTHAAVAGQRDRFTEAAAEAHAGATRPDRPTEPAGDGVINVEPTRAGYTRIAARFRAEAARYDRVAKRLGALTAAVGDPDDL